MSQSPRWHRRGGGAAPAAALGRDGRAQQAVRGRPRPAWSAPRCGGLAGCSSTKCRALDLRLLDLPPGISPAPGEHARSRRRSCCRHRRDRDRLDRRPGAMCCACAAGLPPRWAGAADSIGLASEPPGRARRARLDSARSARPVAGEIEIEVHAAGLNFRDVMWAHGPVAGRGADRRVCRRDLRARMRRRRARGRAGGQRASRSATGSPAFAPASLSTPGRDDWPSGRPDPARDRASPRRPQRRSPSSP